MAWPIFQHAHHDLHLIETAPRQKLMGGGEGEGAQISPDLGSPSLPSLADIEIAAPEPESLRQAAAPAHRLRAKLGTIRVFFSFFFSGWSEHVALGISRCSSSLSVVKSMRKPNIFTYIHMVTYMRA